MKVGVIIERKNYYRLLGTVVEAALARGWEVVCLHDYAQPRGGAKGYMFPAVEAVPRFRQGTPRVMTYHGRQSLPGALREAGLDAALSIVPPPEGFSREGEAGRCTWISLQYNAEILNHLIAPTGLAADAIGVYGPWWIQFGLDYCRTKGLSAPGDAVEEEIRRRTFVVGCPELDQIHAIDRDEVRRRWGIPSGKPVVAFLPYPFRSNLVTPWSRWAYAPGFRAWRRMRLCASGASQLSPQVARGQDDLAMARAVRAFCDANGAHLLVKARLKDPVPAYLRRTADLTLYDEQDYPPTILDVFAVANLCVHFFSTTVLEAVGAGVPSLSLCPTLDDMGVPEWGDLFSREEGGLFQFRGIAQSMGIPEAIEVLPRRRLEDFAPDPAAREAYSAKFLASLDGKSSGRLLDLAQPSQ